VAVPASPPVSADAGLRLGRGTNAGHVGVEFGGERRVERGDVVAAGVECASGADGASVPVDLPFDSLLVRMAVRAEPPGREAGAVGEVAGKVVSVEGRVPLVCDFGVCDGESVAAAAGVEFSAGSSKSTQSPAETSTPTCTRTIRLTAAI
jgi:hypothetical protein